MIIGGAAVGGAVVGALTFRSEVTATFEVKWDLKCVKDKGKYEVQTRAIESNINDSTGDLYWKGKTW